MIDQSREREMHHMKRSLVILMIILGCLLIGMMNISFIGKISQVRENFDSLDEGGHGIRQNAGRRSWLSPANVEAVDGYLNIRDASQYSGGGTGKKEAMITAAMKAG